MEGTYGGVADLRLHATQVEDVADGDERRADEEVQGALLGLEREVAGEEDDERADDIGRDRAQLELDRRLSRVDGLDDGGLREEEDQLGARGSKPRMGTHEAVEGQEADEGRSELVSPSTRTSRAK